jgi:hypothetical protein
MFDRLWVLDKGGYMIYDGDPVEALVYFKTETSQANAAESECPNCGNVETDDILHIIEVKVIDSSGLPGKARQVSPQEWYERYIKKMMPVNGGSPPKTNIPPSNFRVPGKAAQIRTFVDRNITRKLADSQYMIINLVEAPLLAFILGYISKFSANGTYIFADNKNYPVFMFMGIIVALFLGLTVSAEEIFRDRKILEREKFLNLSRLSYLFSKISFLFALSAVQTLSYILVANLIMEVRGVMLQQWIILFSTACFGNLLGLNISAGMRTAVSIYILIPLILVPQLLLGGVMIKFDDMHWTLSRKIYVPVIGDIMVTRWAYEATSVEQFKSNKLHKPFFRYDMEISQYDWDASFLIPNLKITVDECLAAQKNTDYAELFEESLQKLSYHIKDLSEKAGVNTVRIPGSPGVTGFNDYMAGDTKRHLDSLSRTFRIMSRSLSDSRNALYKQIESVIGADEFLRLRDNHYNDALADIVLNRMSSRKIYDAGDRFIQKADPVYMCPGSRWGRAHFFAPFKQIGNLRISTLFFNIIIIWTMIGFLFVTLYYDLLRKFISALERLKLPILRKYGRDLLQF